MILKIPLTHVSLQLTNKNSWGHHRLRKAGWEDVFHHLRITSVKLQVVQPTPLDKGVHYAPALSLHPLSDAAHVAFVQLLSGRRMISTWVVPGVWGVEGERKGWQDCSLRGPHFAHLSVPHAALQSNILRSTSWIIHNHLHRRKQGRSNGVKRTVVLLCSVPQWLPSRCSSHSFTFVDFRYFLAEHNIL